MRFSLHIAWRFLREGATQSVLILLGVTIGVATFVFVSALMAGLQANIINRTLNSQAHVIVEPPDDAPSALMEGDALFARRFEAGTKRVVRFEQWQRAHKRVENTPGVTASCVKVAGSVLVVRGTVQQGAQLTGVNAECLPAIVDLRSAITSGEYRFQGEEALVGVELAEELGIGVGDVIRVTSGPRESKLRVTGLFELGASAADSGWIVAPLRTSQSLLDRVGDISAIDVRVVDAFEAESVAERIRQRTGQDATSWMEKNGQLLMAIQAQNSASTMIRLFVLLAVAMGIASVLIVTVVQRRGQIGIMRAVGTSQRMVRAVFLWQGVFFGLGGAVLGTVMGTVAGKALQQVVFFKISVSPGLVLAATAISLFTGIVSAWMPASRASRLDPAQAIRGEA